MAEPGAAATREAFRDALVSLMEVDERLVCIDTDSGLFKDVDFGAAAERYVNIGIAEANLMGMAAGLAASGRLPFVNTMAGFAATRVLEQVKLDLAYNALPVRIAATHSGLSAGHFGPTHHSLEDLAVMRTLPNMTVLVPADAAQAASLVTQSVDLPGPVYLRLGRKATSPVEAEPPVVGRLQCLRPGDDAVVVAAGPLPVLAALEAAEELGAEGISAAVFNAHTIKPFDAATLVEAVGDAQLVVTVEDHWRTGGLGATVAETLAELEPRRVLRIGVPDTFAKTVGGHEFLLRHYGVHAGAVTECVLRELGGARYDDYHEQRRRERDLDLPRVRP
jgi:transketolase